jgi:hypothetical protein
LCTTTCIFKFQTLLSILFVDINLRTGRWYRVCFVIRSWYKSMLDLQHDFLIHSTTQHLAFGGNSPILFGSSKSMRQIAHTARLSSSTTNGYSLLPMLFPGLRIPCVLVNFFLRKRIGAGAFLLVMQRQVMGGKIELASPAQSRLEAVGCKSIAGCDQRRFVESDPRRDNW